MLKRVISAIVGLAIVALVLMLNNTVPVLFNITISAIAAVCTYELCCAYKTNKRKEFFFPTIIFSAVLPVVAYSIGWASMAFVYAFIVFVVIIFSYKELDINKIVANCSFAVFTSVTLGCLVLLRDYGQGYYGIFYFLLPLVLSWCSDTGALFAGKCIGRTKLCPKISPQKTLEGAIGGGLTAILGMLILCVVSKHFFFAQNININYLNLFIMSILAVPVGILGDLVFSVIKRSCNIKDYGNIMPGHGGLLDRFDSVILVAPFMYIFIRYFSVLY